MCMDLFCRVHNVESKEDLLRIRPSVKEMERWSRVAPRTCFVLDDRYTNMDLYNKVADIPKTMFENQQANARTAISANSQINMIRQLAADPKLMAVYQSIHGKKSNIMDDYNDFIKANPQYLANPEKGLNAFLATQQLLGVGGAGGAGAAGAAGGDLKIVNVRPAP